MTTKYLKLLILGFVKVGVQRFKDKNFKDESFKSIQLNDKNQLKPY